MKLSFIIPTYNFGKKIKKCLASVIAQTVGKIEMEIIVVDDGSTDDTNIMIAEYIDKIRYIKKDNSGVSDARNVGIREATGDYLCFVDADDYISPQLSTYIAEAIKAMPDIVCFEYYEGNKDDFSFEDSEASKLDLMRSTEFSGEQLLLSCLFKKKQDNEVSFRVATVWGKVYKKKFIIDNNICFTSGMVLNEDVLFNAELFRNSPKVLYLPIKLYYYRISNFNSGSIHDENCGDKLLFSALVMKEFADSWENHEVKRRVALRIDSYVQRYLRQYIMADYIKGYSNKRKKYFEYINISVYKDSRKLVNIEDLDITGKLFYICAEKKLFFPLVLREKIRKIKLLITV